MNKFNVGDKVKVVYTGQGFGDRHVGQVATVTEVGFGGYLDGCYCYKILEPIGNNECNDFDGWHGEDSFKLVEKYSPDEVIPPEVVALGDGLVSTQTEWTDKHYDAIYKLTEKDIERGWIKIDPYRVSKQWRLGSKDESGALFHVLKTLARIGEKNSVEREVKALLAQIKCFAEIEGIDCE